MKPPSPSHTSPSLPTHISFGHCFLSFFHLLLNITSSPCQILWTFRRLTENSGHFMHFTCSTQRQSQQTRQHIVTHNKQDYYDCPHCQKLFPQYHGSHKCHIKLCIAKFQARAQEEARSRAEWIETPTPEPYTPIPTDAETDNEDLETSV